MMLKMNLLLMKIVKIKNLKPGVLAQRCKIVPSKSALKKLIFAGEQYTKISPIWISVNRVLFWKDESFKKIGYVKINEWGKQLIWKDRSQMTVKNLLSNV